MSNFRYTVVCHVTITDPMKPDEVYGRIEEALKNVGKIVQVTTVSTNRWVEGASQTPLYYDDNGKEMSAVEAQRQDAAKAKEEKTVSVTNTL